MDSGLRSNWQGWIQSTSSQHGESQLDLKVTRETERLIHGYRSRIYSVKENMNSMGQPWIMLTWKLGKRKGSSYAGRIFLSTPQTGAITKGTVYLLCMKVMTLLSFLRQPSLRQATEWAEVLVEPRWVEPNHLRFRLRCGPAPTGSGPAVLNLHHRSNFTSSPRAAARRPSPLQPPSDYLPVGHIFQLPFDNSIATFRVLSSPFTTRTSHLRIFCFTQHQGRKRRDLDQLCVSRASRPKHHSPWPPWTSTSRWTSMTSKTCQFPKRRLHIPKTSLLAKSRLESPPHRARRAHPR